MKTRADRHVHPDLKRQGPRRRGFVVTDARGEQRILQFEPSPGTVAFLGYGSSLVSARTFGFSDLERVDDGIFLKLAYQFRR